MHREMGLSLLSSGESPKVGFGFQLVAQGRVALSW